LDSRLRRRHRIEQRADRGARHVGASGPGDAGFDAASKRRAGNRLADLTARLRAR